jgi:hypothetical protein
MHRGLGQSPAVKLPSLRSNPEINRPKTTSLPLKHWTTGTGTVTIVEMWSTACGLVLIGLEDHAVVQTGRTNSLMSSGARIARMARKPGPANGASAARAGNRHLAVVARLGDDPTMYRSSRGQVDVLDRSAWPGNHRHR